MAIRERLSGPNDISVADALNTLGISYSHRNRWAEAEASLRRSVEILKMYRLHPCLLLPEGRKKGSEDSIRQAVATWERLLVRIILTLRRV